MHLRSVLLYLLFWVLVSPGWMRGAPPQAVPTQLNIVIIEGEGAINNIRQRTAREPIVEVQDENHRPVAGAAVLFLLPESGPGGTFSGGARTLQVITDQRGRAVAKGFRPTQQAGKYQIRVEASYRGVTADTTITQANAVLTATAAGASGKLFSILAIAGTYAAVGAVAVATRSPASTAPATTQPAPSPPTVLTPGPPTVGAPR
jgi:hypothetical protein